MRGRNRPTPPAAPDVAVMRPDATPAPPVDQDGDEVPTGPAVRRWTTYLCEAYGATAPKAGGCCGQAMTRMQVRLYRSTP